MARVFLPPLITDDRALGGSTIERSLKFHAADNTRLVRTIGSTSNRRTFTYSWWLKRTMKSAEQYLWYNGHASSTPYFDARFEANTHEFQIQDYHGGSSRPIRFITRRRFKDGNSWYHFVYAVDTTQGVASNRVKLYVNGVQETSFSTETYPSQNFDSSANVSGNLQVWGTNKEGTSNDLDGYLAEAHLVDGQQLTPSSFGYTDPQTGIWRPKKYEGTHGTNGFYLDFNDNSAATAATIGKDRSGNGNDFTPSNFSVSTGVGNDSSLDTPSNNFCTWNAQFGNPSNYLIPSEGNLQCNGASGNNHMRQQSTKVLHSGKWYAEFKIISGYDSANGTIRLGVCTPNAGHRATNNDGFSYENSNNFTTVNYAMHEGKVYQDISASETTILSSLTTFANGDTLGIALDLDNDRFFVSKNGTFFSNGTGTQDPATGANPLYSGGVLTSRKNLDGFVIAAGVYSDKVVTADFGQHGFAYTPPTGFKAICSNNIAPTSPNINPKKHFDILLWTGNSTNNRVITGLEFQPDLVWIKKRNVTNMSHYWISSVQTYTSTGTGNGNVGAFVSGTNANDAEGTTTDAGFASFNSDGFTLGKGNNDGNADSAYQRMNANSANYVAWCWKAGGNSNTFNIDGKGYATAAAAGLDGGSIDPTGASINTEAGFSMLTYTGTNNASETIAHGLGKKPAWIIVKSRSVGGQDWVIYNQNLDGGNQPATHILKSVSYTHLTLPTNREV